MAKWWRWPRASLGLGISLALGWGLPAVAQNCTVACRSEQIRFVPGQRLQLVVVNRGFRPVMVEKMGRSRPLMLPAGQSIDLSQGFDGTRPNMSVTFWDETTLPVRVELHRPTPNQLRIEFVPTTAFTDRAVYILNDGRVLIY